MSNKTVLSLFLDQAILRPSFPAVVSSGKVVSYAELDKRSDVVSAALRRHGVGRDDLVPILAERSVDLLVALLGVLKTGASYVPVDRTHPDKRKENIARQCAAKLLLATRDERPELAGRPVVRVEDLIAHPPDSAPPEGHSAPSATDVAYVIFTSGTTGAPKGVVVEHHSLASLMLWHNVRFGVEASSRTTLMAGVGFDVSQWEIWSTLVAGGSIHLLDESARLDPEQLLLFYAEHAISHTFVPTVFVPNLVQIPQPETLSLRYLFTAGEKLRPVETEHLPYTLVDYYGPTESTIFATVNVVGDARPDCADTIGHPVAGCQVCIVDDALKPVADGEVGELLIAGSCLARGYLGDPELTAERFVAVPAFAARAYRTGDLARRLPDGSIQFLGRRDNQVKIRGNRVELGEIETTLLRDPSVQDALVLLEDGPGRAEKRVVAFVVPRPADRTDDVVPRLRASLKQELPDYMWPSAYVCLDAMPRTLNDKIDREVLRARFDEARGRDRQGAREAWGDELERRIADVWHEMLGHGTFGADDSFFDVGGHSLLASALVRELSARLSVKTYIRDIYESATIGGSGARATGNRDRAGRRACSRVAA